MHGATSESNNYFEREDAARQLKLLTSYIAEAGVRLRQYTRLDVLLKQLVGVIHDLPGFIHCTLYIADHECFYQLTSSIYPDDTHPRHTLPGDLVQHLLDEHQHATVLHAAATIPPATNEYILISQQLPPRSTRDTAPLLIAVPLQGQSSLLGLLICQGPLTTDLDTVLPQLALFADEIAMLLELSHLHEEIHRISNERLALIEVGRALAAPEALQNVQMVYRVIYEQIKRIMPVDTFYINSYNRGKKLLERTFQVIDGRIELSPPESYLPSELKRIFSIGPQYGIFHTKDDFINYISSELPDVYKLYQDLEDTRKPGALLFTAVCHGNESVGMLEVHSSKEHSYQQKHLQMLREIAILAGAAIQKARMYEDLRSALAQAQESERLKNRFLMIASHELRTPLTAVHGYLEMLDDMHQTLDKELKARFISNARRACEELVLITSTIMDASRLDQDKVELRREAVWLKQTVQTIQEILQPPPHKEGRAVAVNVPEHLYVRADDLRLRQILLKLLNNALKYTPIGTPITITAQELRGALLRQHFPTSEQMTTLATERDYVVISVRDQGPGITPAKQLELFSKFARLEEAINSQQRGAGLGLYLCRQFAEAMDGAIWLESTSVTGEGCTFHLALPLTNPDQQ